MPKISNNLKLVISSIILFSLIVFSLQKNSELLKFDPQSTVFASPTGPKTLNQFKDKIVLMYFGFLSCPEACPTTMTRVSKAFKELSPDELDKIVFLFIDLDPKRDTIEKLNEYTSYFHPKIIPLSAKESTTRPFSRFFGVEYQKVQIKSNMNYTIDHSTDIVVLNRAGKILTNIHHDSSAELLKLTLKNIVKEQFSRN